MPGRSSCWAARLILATILLRRAPDAVGVAGGGLTVLAATAVAFVPVRGRSIEQWAPTASRRAVASSGADTGPAPHRVQAGGRRRAVPAAS